VFAKIFPWEDRNAVHRIKADEAYLIGDRGHPVRAYLDIDDIVRVAVESGADAIYPGYGFLSENPALASACEQAGIVFIGPPPAALALVGNKVRALAAARRAGIPVLGRPGSSPPPARPTATSRCSKPATTCTGCGWGRSMTSGSIAESG
jgi:pyruvate carboxylase